MTTSAVKHVLVAEPVWTGYDCIQRYDVPEDARVQLRYDTSGRAEMSLYVTVPDDGPDGERIDFQIRVLRPEVRLNESTQTFIGYVLAGPPNYSNPDYKYVEREVTVCLVPIDPEEGS